MTAPVMGFAPPGEPTMRFIVGWGTEESRVTAMAPAPQGRLDLRTSVFGSFSKPPLRIIDWRAELRAPRAGNRYRFLRRSNRLTVHGLVRRAKYSPDGARGYWRARKSSLWPG